MLGEKDAMATVAVKDLMAAKKFYEETLGLTLLHEEGGGARLYKSGKTSLLVYESKYAGTNEATAVTWSAGKDVETIVDGLRGKGVVFEHYDMPGMTLQGDVHVGGSMKIAWFEDPDGNIHALISE
ncbi:MAG TPA: VOC family protein [Thermoanaerobaculia bacterium]|nr:VOC family protein [Thermoanaerobaculia bacterium]